MEFSLILVAVVAIAVVIGLIVAAVAYKRRNTPKETDYRTFFFIGLSWMVISIVFGAIGHFLLEGIDAVFLESPLFIIGLVFFIIGISNKDKWKK